MRIDILFEFLLQEISFTTWQFAKLFQEFGCLEYSEIRQIYPFQFQHHSDHEEGYHSVLYLP